MLTSLQVGSPVSYLIAVVIPALDAIFPVLPSETVIIALGVATAGSADPRIALLVACAAAGAFLGDNLSYLIGRRFGPWAERRFFASGKGARRRVWAERSLQRFGMQVIIACRFIPGGRTAITLTCGLIGYQRRKFVLATAVAAVIWALYAFFTGRLVGWPCCSATWPGQVTMTQAEYGVGESGQATRMLVDAGIKDPAPELVMVSGSGPSPG
jgi:membrane protein DedA with SNARE-associated domain